MIISTQVIAVAILLVASIVESNPRDEKSIKVRGGEGFRNFKNDTTSVEKPTRTQQQKTTNQKYSSRIVGNRYALTDNVFGIRTFPVSKTNVVDDENHKTKIKIDASTTTESVLDFRIAESKRRKDGAKEKDDGKKKKDMSTASAGGGKQKKEADDEDEKTLAQQVADGKYGLIQNEIFANGSKRTGIISYSPNSEVPKDTKENLGGLEKDEIWLAEDHILVLRGGNYQDIKENETPSSPKWPPIDDYRAPNRQVKIPKNPEIPPPFPVQLSEDGPVEFIKGQHTPPPIPPVIPPLPPFAPDSNKTVPFPFPVPIPDVPPAGNKTLPFPIPPHLLPPFLSNLPPGATFVAPPDNRTDFDEDDPSIYYPPKYDFYYPLDNSTAVPPGPLVPGIILPPPPDFFSLLDNDTDSLTDYQNETDDSINSVTPTYVGPKYLPASRKFNRPRISNNRYLKRPITVTNLSDVNNNIPESSSKPDKPAVTYVYPENSKSKSLPPSTPSYNTFRTSIKVPPNKHPSGFSTPIFVPSNPNRSLYHPLPTTSPKPNHITLPTTKALPKQIFIITTPETVDKNRIEDIYKKSKPVDVNKYETINPELHPLRSLIKPNVTVSYNGKYGHLPPATVFPHKKPQVTDDQVIRGHLITQPPVTKASKAPSTDINSITVTPIPVIKKIRVLPIQPGKPEVITPPPTPSKATFYFYEEPSTTEIPAPVQKPEKPKEMPTKTQFNAEGGVKTDTKPVTQYYYTTKSTTKTPIRQFLEETFHSSNVLPRKPQIAHINNAEIITHNSYSDIPKMKHLNYGTHVSPKPVIKYHYVTEDNAVIIPSPKIKDLEIKNSGSSGLQNVNLDKAVIRPTPKPIIVQEVLQPTPKPETQNPPSVTYVATPKPTEYKTADGPFIPSNYYATVRPEHIHFTSQEQTLVDDITKNYFTIFGQKINSPSTTPLTPVKSTGVKNKSKPESGLTYISDDGHNFKIQQVHESSSRKPGKSSTIFYTSEKSKVPSSTRPPSNFEKYLKELTGEDQSDYIISGVFPAKIKKGKGFAGAAPVLDGIPSHLLSQGPVIFRNEQVPPSQSNSQKNPEQDATRSKIPFQPTYSTTLRPVVDVEIKPQYIQHLPPVSKPLEVYRQPIPPQNIRVNHNFQQYFQELTGLTSPTTTRPVKVKKPNIEYFPSTPSPLKAISYQQPPFQLPEIKPKPISLEGDILINYKQPRPPINSEAELINIQNPRLPFDLSPNIKIVDSPDLSRNPNQAYSTKQITFGVAKDLLENLPKSGYFTEPHQPGGNSFVSYNLPGNGGHFYFLTPQIVEKEKDEDIRRGDKGYKRVNRSEDGSSRRSGGNVEGGGYSSQIEHNLEDGYSNHDYLRRRRKKP